MDELCGADFWDWNLTWYTENPDFTTCFKGTFLVWIPCVFLWIFLPLQIYNMKTSEYRDVPWSCFNTIKMILITITIILALLNIVHDLFLSNFEPKIYFISTIVTFVTGVLFVILTYSSMKMGITSSGILLTFSFILVLCGLPTFLTAMKNWNSFVENIMNTKQLSQISTYLANVIIFILNCFADEPLHRALTITEKKITIKNTSVLSDIFSTWMDPYFWKNYKKPTTKILWDYHYKDDGSENLIRKKYSSNSTDISILKLLHKKYSFHFWCCLVLCSVYEILGIGIFVMIGHFLFAIQAVEPKWRYYFYVVSLFIVSMLQVLIISYYFKLCLKLEIKIKNAVLITLYEKALRISNHTRTEYTTSDIVSMMSLGVNHLQLIPRTINSLCGILIQITLSYLYLSFLIGPSTIFNIIAFIVLLITSYFTSIRMKKLQIKGIKLNNKRNRFMQEIFSGIKVLKMYAWEYSFKRSVNDLREKEENNLKRINFVYTLFQTGLTLSPYLLFIISYIGTSWISPNLVIGIVEIFMMITIFYSLRIAMNILPSQCLSVQQGLAAAEKIDKFLSSEELDPNAISHDSKIQYAVLMKKANFSWINKTGPPLLRNMDIKIKKGELVAIIGSVGTGKSSFISACLGEMYKMSGYANTNGSIAYVPQQAWILNTTFKENITLNNNINEKLYEKTLEICALKRDIETFSGGDSIEIGEKGINLSGGQKQRVSLARAICQNADIYYLDDPLSALDSHVADHIFLKAIGSTSVLKDKTRILVTHSAKFFPFADKIIVLKDGQIAEIGTYEELLSENGELVEFMHANLEKTGKNSANKEEKDFQQFFDYDKLKFETDPVLSENDRTVHNSTNLPSSVPNKLIDEESVQTDQVHKTLFYSFINMAGVCRTIIVIIQFIATQANLCAIDFLFCIWMNGTHDSDYFYLSIYAVSAIINGLTTYFGNVYLFEGIQTALSKLHNKLLNSVLRWPMYLFDTIPVGRIISRFSDDLYVLDNVIGNIICQTLTLLCRFMGLIFLMIVIAPESSLILIPTFIILYIIQKLYASMFHQMKRVEAVHRTPFYSHLVETIAGLQSIRSYNFENKFITLTIEKNKLCSKAYYSSVMCTRWLYNRCETLGTIFYFLLGILIVYKKDNTYVGLLAILLVIGILVHKGLSVTVIQFSQLGDDILALERIQQYIMQPHEASWEHSLVTVDKEWPQKGVIVFDNYKLQYRPGLEYVLKGISFRIESGEKVGIIGRTGAGKSSTFLGLFRIVEPTEGKILIDDVDITKIGLHELRSKITVIPQDPVLFSGTLRFNIDSFEQHTDESLWNVLEKSHLKQFTNSLPEGLNYMIEEGGKNLSFGQKQLICLARALLRKTKILVLDEATASVDVKTDELIQKTIRKEFSNCTVITIAHRLNTLQNYDKILMIDNGKIVRYATVKKLTKSGTSELMNFKIDSNTK